MTVTIHQGDVFARLAELPDDSVHCVVTSPPYWGLRDYGVAGQLGLEPTYQEHIDAMAAVFREVRRVLRPDGTLWLNYGDSYATSVNGRSAADTKIAGNDDRTFRDKPFSTVQGVLKSKDLCGIPWRVALALQEGGWWLRQDIIWHKPNPMPESIRDRCTKSHEYIFLPAKSERYYFDQKAIAEPVTASTVARLAQANLANQTGSDRVPGKTNGRMRAVPPRHAKYASSNRASLGDVVQGDGLRNRRSVWTVTTKPFKEAHFATFPPDLIEPCILAGCPIDGVVLDPFFGAGTTGLVAQRNGRDCIGIELNPEYIAIARKRLGLPAVSDMSPDNLNEGVFA